MRAWAGLDSNHRATDYESAALTAELPARSGQGYPRARPPFLRSVDVRIGGCSGARDGLVSMAISPRRKLAVGATGLLVFAGAGGAYAATQNSTTKPDPASEQKAFLDDLAGRLNVTPDKLQAAIKGAVEDRIDAAVAAGRLLKE